ncbi:DNA mismatch repair protein Msh6 [Folsomia candida]|uniref:DNA mismatch repair protein Msh6 n=1 Tax=Folsomia candida TaxID=158441 RepID=UPI000B90607B|nr:DNA mismatch repair protein Msh6 [Folsomia candida]XP_035708640.1 DNA mismatch repair protein Msh6 [Folsomia candida]
MAPPTKPPTTPQSNTLLNYFSRSVTPKTSSTATTSRAEGDNDDTPAGPSPFREESSSKPVATEESITPSYAGETPKKSGKKTPLRRRIQRIESESDEENQSPKEEEKVVQSKKKKKAAPSDESGDDYKPSDDDEEEDEEDEESAETSEPESDDGSGSDDDDKPRSSQSRNKKRNVGGSGIKRKSVSSPVESSLRKKIKTFSTTSSPVTPTSTKATMKAKTPTGAGKKMASGSQTPGGDGSDERHPVDGGGSIQWPHLKLEWLKPEKRRDSKKRLMSDPMYDPTTLDVPMSYINEQTPVQRQWWEMKKSYFDTVLFFKMGKFYELFHMDAVIAVEELDIIFMKGDVAHAGFPEKSYSYRASTLINKGYKVARIEQTETPDMMNERLKTDRKKGRSVPKYANVVNREVCQITTRGVRTATALDRQYENINPESAYLYSVVAKVASSTSTQQEVTNPTFGVCFIDTTIGEFHVSQFEDDRFFSRLRTLFSHHVPAQVIVKKGNLPSGVDQLINGYAQVRKEEYNSQIPAAEKIIKTIKEDSYFYDKASGDIVWPDAFKTLLDSGEMTAEKGWELAVQAFGLITQCLKQFLVDYDLLSLKRFSIYNPVDSLTISGPNDVKMPTNMVLDGISLQNLDITESSASCFNLLSKVNTCFTPFGKRLLRQWICTPLAIPEEIESRLDAIQELMSYSTFINRALVLLKGLPDLERLLSKVHLLGSAHRKQNHPEGRAIMFEEVTYSKNKISDLLSIINGFKSSKEIIVLLQEHEVQSQFLQNIINRFPNIGPLLKRFDDAFDHADAVKEGKIIPKDGADSEYDQVQVDLEEVKNESERYLKQITGQLKTRVSYFGSAKNRFQLEVSDNTKVPREFELSSSKKGYKRYMTAETKEFLDRIQRIETKREEVLRDITRRVFEKFDKSHDTWKVAISCIAELDAIISLKTFSESQEEMCRPKVVFSRKPFFKLKNGRHPCMAVESYIANSCYLGVSRPNNAPFGCFSLLTGPNMGGKSTLMRQVALIAVLAHMGCYVPATACEMSIIDRIFTRIGASDNLGDGESTFFVELSEASAILRHCTKDSLVLMDELGRGTATYDGTAIAHAVATKLANDGVRTLFSTHYHTLVESIQHLPMIQLGHMACMVENENEEDPTQETVTFLYKIAPGPCPKSYGFNAAKLAGMPDEVIRDGHLKAKEFETITSNVTTFRQIIGEDKLSLQNAMQILKI